MSETPDLSQQKQMTFEQMQAALIEVAAIQGRIISVLLSKERETNHSFKHSFSFSSYSYDLRSLGDRVANLLSLLINNVQSEDKKDNTHE